MDREFPEFFKTHLTFISRLRPLEAFEQRAVESKQALRKISEAARIKYLTNEITK